MMTKDYPLLRLCLPLLVLLLLLSEAQAHDDTELETIQRPLVVDNSSVVAIGNGTATTVSTSSSPPTGCFQQGRGGCASQGNAGELGSPEMCQIQCLATRNCKYWSWRPDRSGLCLLCNDDRENTDSAVECGTIPNNKPQCMWGPRTCNNDEVDPSPEEAVSNILAAALTFCGGSDDTIMDISEIQRKVAYFTPVVRSMVDGTQNPTNSVQSADDFALILQRSDCHPTVCNGGALLWTSMEQFIVVMDDNTDRALPRNVDIWRRAIFNEFHIFLADAHWLDKVGTEDVYIYFKEVPLHLREGFIVQSPFLTMTVRDAYKCGSNGMASGKFFQVTPRGFNVFHTWPGSRMEDAFVKTPKSQTNGDLFQTVLRHEAAHQFDRTMNLRQRQLRTLLLNQCERDTDWLRTGVGNAYFKDAQGEIIASQVGNQYFLSSSAQLAVGRYYAQYADTRRKNLLPLAWFVFNVDLVGEENMGTFYEDEQNQRVRVQEVLLSREGSNKGRIRRLSIPGCGTFDFQYDDEGISGYTYDGDPAWDSCRPEGAVTSIFPTTTQNPSMQPTTYVDHYLLVCGSQKVCLTRNLERPARQTERHPVRCCSPSNTLPFSSKKPGCDVWGSSMVGPGGTCMHSSTHDEAIEICASHPQGRLCTESELTNMCTRGTSCNLDGKVVWSSTLYVQPTPTPSSAPSSMPSTTTCRSLGSKLRVFKKLCNRRANPNSKSYATFWEIDKNLTQEQLLDQICDTSKCTKSDCCKVGRERKCSNTDDKGREAPFEQYMCPTGWIILEDTELAQRKCGGRNGRKCTHKNCCKKE